MTATTTRGGFRYPQAGDNSRNVRTDIANLASDVATKTALYAEGTAASRPAAGTAGRLYRATDTGQVCWDTGTSWDDVGVSRSGGSTITPSGTAVKGLVVRGTSGQMEALIELQASNGTVLAVLDAGGALESRNAHVAAGGYVGGRLSTTSRDATEKALVVRGQPAQAGNLAEFQNSSGTALAIIDSGGYVHAPSLFLTNVATTPTAGAQQGFLVFSINGATAKIPYCAT